MSFDTLRPYIQSRLRVVDPDLTEWEDAFNIENIPASILDKAWHLTFGAFLYVGTAHNCFAYQCPITLRLFLKGYRTPQLGVDSALFFSESITKEVCKPSQRLTQAKIKNVLPTSINIRELAQDNDNTVILEMGFNFNVFLEII